MSNNIKYTFFNAIGTADIERIHSAVIGWMLSDKCDAFSNEEKSTLINKLFQTEEKVVYKKIESKLEYDHIDVYIETEYEDNKRQEWIIENKIKSSQGTNQLSNYKTIHPNANYLLLSLIGENGDDGWVENTYAELYSILNGVLDKCDKENSRHITIIEEYVDTLQTLVTIVKEFIEAPEEYANVFTECSKKKSEKQSQYENKICEYISHSNLETILQKLYFTKIKSDIQKDVEAEIRKKIGNTIRWEISESHGNAQIVILIDGENNTQFEIAFQGGKFKFAVSKDYQKKEKDDFFINEWTESLQKIKDGEICGYTKLNLPRSRSRVSVSKEYPTENSKNWWQNPLSDVTEQVKKQFCLLPDLIESASKS